MGGRKEIALYEVYVSLTSSYFRYIHYFYQIGGVKMSRYSQKCIARLESIGAPCSGWICESVETIQNAVSPILERCLAVIECRPNTPSLVMVSHSGS